MILAEQAPILAIVVGVAVLIGLVFGALFPFRGYEHLASACPEIHVTNYFSKKGAKGPLEDETVCVRMRTKHKESFKTHGHLRGEKKMRQAFSRQRRLDCDSPENVSLNSECRYEIISILRGLQHIYSQPVLRDEVLGLIAQDVNCNSRDDCGRPGMDYWEILVLSSVRWGCNFRTPDIALWDFERFM